MGHFGARYTEANASSSSTSSAASAGSPARARRPTARAPCGRTSSARSWSATSTARWGSTSPPTARSTGPRSVPTQGYESAGLREDARPRGPAEQQDHGRGDPDPRRPRQLRGRRAGDEPAAGLRPLEAEQASHLRLLLAAEPGLADVGRQPDRRLQPGQPLHAEPRRHRVRAARGAGGSDPAHPFVEAQILRVPKAKITGSPSGFTGGPRDTGPGHVGGAGLEFDSAGQPLPGRRRRRLPERPGPQPLRADGLPRVRALGRAQDRRPTRRTCAARSLRIRPLARGPAERRAGLRGRPTRSRPATCSRRGWRTRARRSTRWASGSRSRCTRTRRTRARSSSASSATTTRSTRPTAAPAGVCEWNLVDKPGFHGWPFCVGDNSSINTTWRWNYANNTSTGQQYNCSLQDLPSDLDWAPPGQTAAPPTFQGRAMIPGPGEARDGLEEVPEQPGLPESAGLRRPRAPAASSRSPARCTATRRAPDPAPSRRTSTAPG